MNGCLSLLLFGFFFLLAGFLINVFRFGFGIWHTTRHFRRTMKDFERAANGTQSKPEPEQPKSKDGKIFSRDEGQYVDFEEMK